MQTADESYKAELQKFKEDMNKALLEINTLVFMLELGSYGMKPSIRDVLKLHGNIPDDIRNAFDELNKSKGDEYVYRSENPTSNFVEQCALSWE